MILSYRDLFQESKRRIRIKAEITTEHSVSSYGQPLIVLPDGGPIDLLSWVSLDYRVVRANKKESEELARLGLLE
ncbi:MAG: hypothetical protein C0399_03420 [Syntrophus sp. (in: bacteria)]|nr:hypothetical protein [Syntrophus sp. (in: bacteria)]